MPQDAHTLIDGKVHVYRREGSRFWQCAVFIGGANQRSSTRQTNLAAALDYAKDWYLDQVADGRLRQRGIELPRASGKSAAAPSLAPTNLKRRSKEKDSRPTFRQAAKAFVTEYQVITHGERNARYVAGKSTQLDCHLIPFFGDTPVEEVTAGKIQEYRVYRLTPPAPDKAPAKPKKWRRGERRKPQRTWKRPARNTLHSEIVTLRQVLKTANRKGWIAGLPDMSTPYKASGKVGHRAWFSPEEYRSLYEATRERARNPLNERWRWECEQFHDWVLFMVNTGLRPDEGSQLQYRDVQVVEDAASGQRILEIEVRGKRGVGYCKSMPGAVHPLLRLRKRNNPGPSDVIFGPVQRELLNALLAELDLKKDRSGNARTAYSLRHTYICLRLMEGADIYQLAKNCRTSVEMIEKHYAIHLKDMLDASAINVRKPFRPRKGPSEKPAQANA